MPDPPSVSPLTYYLFDNAWPVVALLIAMSLLLALAAQRTGRRNLLLMSGGSLVLAATIFIVERVVVTSGERAAEVTRQLVDAAERADVDGAMNLFSDDAVMALISPRNPGVGINVIRSRIELVRGRYRMRSCRISSLRSYSAARDRGVVHLRVVSEFEGGLGYTTPSAWVIEVRPDDDGSWKISHITFVEYNIGQRPGMELFR